ncbi:MAG TPA: cupin domain-containing protein [Caulobacteraceae bacterium]|nr:cupin domain-containing protein [Caulobacteraceae bacterium]
MKFIATIIAIAALALPAAAQPPAQAPRVPAFTHALTNVPGKSLIAVEVNYAPGQASPPHRHAKSAFIMAYVVSGAVVSQVEGQPEKTYRAGETWYENPGDHHVVSRNASATEPAKMLAVFVVDSDDRTLTTIDPRPN